MTTLNGACLCGNISFSVEAQALNLYQCHCSLCRKMTGAAASAACFASAEAFRWLRGEDGITRYRKETGYTVCFCNTCGSPVPNAFQSLYWIPAGLLTANAEGQVVMHLHLDSRAVWESVAPGGVCYAGAPDLQTLIDMTCCKSRAMP